MAIAVAVATEMGAGEPVANPYLARFHTYVGRGIEQVLCELAAAPDRLPDELRKQAVHLVGLGLEIPALWAPLRRLLLVLSPQMEQAGFRDEWIFFLERALVCAQQQQDAETEVELHLQSGRLYEFTGDLAAATAHFQQGLTLAEEAGNPRNQGRCLGRLAYIARLRYELATATRLANCALQLIAPEDRERARIHSVLGTIAYDQQAWETSIKHYQQALAIWECVGDKRMIAWSLRDLGTVYQQRSDLDQAINCYKRALQYFDVVRDQVHQASTHMNLANVYLVRNQPDNALSLYEKTLPVFREAADPRRLAMIYVNIGIAYRQLNRGRDSTHALQQSVYLWRKLNNRMMIANALSELGSTYASLAMNCEAIEQLEEAKTLLASDGSAEGQLLTAINHQLAQLHCSLT